MNVTALVKAAHHQKALSEAVQLFKAAKKLRPLSPKSRFQSTLAHVHKAAVLAAITQFTKEAQTGHMTKQAILPQLGAVIMKLLGKGLRGGGHLLGRIAPRAGASVSRTGRNLQHTARRAVMTGTPKVAPVINDQANPVFGSQAARQARAAPKSSIAREYATTVGSGVGGAGAYGLLSSLLGGSHKEQEAQE